MLRMIYAIWHAITHYQCVRSKKQKFIENIKDISHKYLQEKQTEILALDFDGVLSAHGEPEPAPETKIWLDHLCLTWPQSKIVILSNKPQAKRIAFFNKYYPQITFIKSQKKKPYPDGLHQIAKLKKVPVGSILLVDDRLLTGMLACCLAGAQGTWLARPLRNLHKRPITESFFALLRFVERIFF